MWSGCRRAPNSARVALKTLALARESEKFAAATWHRNLGCATKADDENAEEIRGGVAGGF